LLVTLICCAPLVVPTGCVPNVRLVGESITPAWPALPLKATVCDAILPPNATVSVPVRGPVTEGLKTTLMSHFCPAATPAEQLSVSRKSPMIDTIGDAAASPKFPTCTSCEELKVPTF
jgi:hypothetical protein